MKYAARIAPGLLLLLLLVAACDSGGGDDVPHSVAGEATLHADEGVDFGTGAAAQPFKTSDLYATTNGGGLRLTAGGVSQAMPRGATWFARTRAEGGGFQEFTSLDDVPASPLPTPDDQLALQKAATGHGFIIANQRGGYTKGWIREADADSVTVEFAPLP